LDRSLPLSKFDKQSDIRTPVKITIKSIGNDNPKLVEGQTIGNEEY
jgi:hypothetical protein